MRCPVVQICVHWPRCEYVIEAPDVVRVRMRCDNERQLLYAETRQLAQGGAKARVDHGKAPVRGPDHDAIPLTDVEEGDRDRYCLARQRGDYDRQCKATHSGERAQSESAMDHGERYFTH